MKLSDIADNAGSRKKRMRVGRGIGSGNHLRIADLDQIQYGAVAKSDASFNLHCLIDGDVPLQLHEPGFAKVKRTDAQDENEDRS